MPRPPRSTLVIILGFALLMPSCFFPLCCSKKQTRETTLSPADWPPGEMEKYQKLSQLFGQPHPLGEGSKGMVVGALQPLAIRAGLEALKQGGTAADAAITTALAQIVFSVGSGVSFAGVMDMLYYEASSGKVYSMNAEWNTVQGETDPLSIPPLGTASGRSAFVPGFMAGVQAAHDRFGRLPFAKLFEPAIYFAQNGILVNSKLAGSIEFRKDVLSRLPEAKRIFTKEGGEFYRESDLLKQPQLAETLKNVAARGADYMYRGEWAKRFVEAIQRDGGKMTLKDLEDYKVIWADPVQTDYHGYNVFTFGLPAGGGVHVITALNMLEAADLAKFGHYTSSPEALYWLIQIVNASQEIGSIPPDLAGKYLPGIDLSPESRLKKETANLVWGKMHEPGWALLKKEALELSKTEAKSAEALWNSMKKLKHTDAVVAIDEKGNIAAVEHTCNCVIWGTTGIFVDGVSVPDAAAFSQNLNQAVGPGKRLWASGNPTIVLKNGKPMLAASSLGNGFYQVMVQNLVNILDFGMDPKTAVDTPNFLIPIYPSETNKQGIPEGEFSEDVLDAVRSMGQELKIASKEELWYLVGYWIGIKIDPKTGKLQGGVTRYFNGCAEGF